MRDEPEISEQPKIASSIDDVEVGVIFCGRKVTQVTAKGPTHIVFMVEGLDTVQFRCTDNEFSGPTAKLEAARFEAQLRFKKEKNSEINPLYGLALRRIFTSKDDIDHIISDFKESVDRIPEVINVIGRHNGCAVWQDSTGSIDYRHDSPTAEIDQAISEFTRLKSLGNAILPEEARRNFNNRLGAALDSAFKLKSNGASFFLPLEKFVIDRVQSEVKLRVLVITVLLAIVLMGFMTLSYYRLDLPEFVRLSLISSVGGVAGALISFLERSKTAKIGEFDLAPFVILNSVTRVLIGGLFGIIAFSAMQADVAFTIFKESKAALLLLGVASGFSERLIPDVLGSITPTKSVEVPSSDGTAN